MKNKSSIILLVLVVALALVALIFGKSRFSSQQDKNAEIKKQPPKAVSQSLIIVSPKFPKGLPLETGVNALNAYEINTKPTSYNISYNSKKSLQENAKIYKTYIESSGFKIVKTIEKADTIFYNSSKDGNTLSAFIRDKNGQIKVSLTYEPK